jgi:hypothetical protein
VASIVFLEGASIGYHLLSKLANIEVIVALRHPIIHQEGVQG